MKTKRILTAAAAVMTCGLMLTACGKNDTSSEGGMNNSSTGSSSGSNAGNNDNNGSNGNTARTGDVDGDGFIEDVVTGAEDIISDVGRGAEDIVGDAGRGVNDALDGMSPDENDSQTVTTSNNR